MYLNKIFKQFFPNKTWQLAFFSLLAICFSIFIAILFEMNHLNELNPIVKKPNILNSQKNGGFSLLELNGNSIEIDPITLLDQVEVIGIQKDLKKVKLRLKDSLEEIEIDEKTPVFWQFDSSGRSLLISAIEESPIYFAAEFEKNRVIFSIYRRAQDQNAYIKIGRIAKELKMPIEEIEKIKKVFSKIELKIPTLFDQLYRDSNDFIKLELDGQSIPIEKGSKIGFDGQAFFNPPLNPSFLLEVLAIDSNKIVMECWDPSLFYCCRIEKILKVEEKRFFASIDEPKQVSLRGFDAVYCLFYGKKQMIKQGDFFFKEGAEWKKIVSLEEFNQLIEYKLRHEIFVVEKIYQQDKTIYIQGKVFDQTGWNYTPLSWKFERKKEKRSKEVPKLEPSGPGSFEATERNELGALDEVL